MVLEDGDRFRVAFVACPAEHVGDGPAAEMCGEQIVGELLGGRAGEEVIAAGLRLAGRVPPAVGDTFRVGNRLDTVDEIPHPRGAFALRVGDTFRVEHPDSRMRMVMFPDRAGRVEDIALVRCRHARARRGQDRRHRVAQGFT